VFPLGPRLILIYLIAFAALGED